MTDATIFLLPPALVIAWRALFALVDMTPSTSHRLRTGAVLQASGGALVVGAVLFDPPLLIHGLAMIAVGQAAVLAHPETARFLLAPKDRKRLP